MMQNRVMLLIEEAESETVDIGDAREFLSA